MESGSLIVVVVLLLLAVIIGIWWSGQRFWHYSLAPTLEGANYWTKVKLVLLASLWHLLVYGVTAVFFLPWLKGAAHGNGATLSDWQQAHFNHDFWLLVLGGLGGAATLFVRGRRIAALCWLAGSVLVLAGFRGPRTYQAWASEQRPQVEGHLSNERALTITSATPSSLPRLSGGAASRKCGSSLWTTLKSRRASTYMWTTTESERLLTS